MIFTFEGNDFGYEKIFHNRNLDINDWNSKIPGMDFFQATVYDSTLRELFKSNNMYEGTSYIARTALYNVITSTRILVGKLASTVGFLQTDFINISNSFKEAPDQVITAFNTASAILNSDLFQKGMDALGAIPIIGWILKIIVKIAEMIYKLYDNIIKKKIIQTETELKNQPWIPISQFSQEADQEVTKFTLDKIKTFDINYCFSPRNYWENLADFSVLREKKGENQKFTDFYNINSLRDINGTGFIPGTTVLTSNLRLITKAGSVHQKQPSQIFDSGDFYPTVRSLCNQLYQIIQKIGPSLYTIDCIHLTKLWENNINALLEYNEESIKLGWAWYPTSCIKEINSPDCNTKKPYFICDEEMAASGYDSEYTSNHPKCNKKSHIGNKISVNEKDIYWTHFRNYIADTYFNGHFKNKFGKSLPYYIDNINEIDISQSVPSKALKILQERQKAAINSLICAYITDDERFPSIKGELKTTLYTNFNKILNSDEWKKLYWRDIVDPEFKSAVADKAKKLKLSYDKSGPILDPLKTKASKSVLSNPQPPKPFEPVVPKRKGRSDKQLSNNISSILPLAAGGLAAYFLLK